MFCEVRIAGVVLSLVMSRRLIVILLVVVGLVLRICIIVYKECKIPIAKTKVKSKRWDVRPLEYRILVDNTKRLVGLHRYGLETLNKY